MGAREVLSEHLERLKCSTAAVGAGPVGSVK